MADEVRLPKELKDILEMQAAELKWWRERYPRMTHVAREEAAAKVGGREPKHIPSKLFGSSS